MNAVKVTMNLTQDNVDFVEEMAAKPGSNKTSIVNHAIELEKYMRDAVKRGAKILIEEQDGAMKEVVIR